MRKKPKKIQNRDIPSSKIYFQYEPKTFLKEFFPGDESEMLRVSNSPHYEFAKLYMDIGRQILTCYNDTRYVRLMIAWGRDDKHNKWKVGRFLETFDSIKKKGLSSRVIVLSKPLYKQTFGDPRFAGRYEIFHGHHRAAICAALNIEPIPCTLSKI